MHFIPDGLHCSAGDIHCHHTITGVEVLEEGLYSLLVHQKTPLEREGGERGGRGREGRGENVREEGGRKKGREKGGRRENERKGKKEERNRGSLLNLLSVD